MEGGWNLFALAVSIAKQLLSDSTLSVFDTEMFRRCWWTLFKLQSRQLEEESSRLLDSMIWGTVPRPVNINDMDLFPTMHVLPQTRIGATDMSLCLLQFELKSMVPILMGIRSSTSGNPYKDYDIGVVSARLKTLKGLETMLETNFLQFFHESRPLDHIGLILVQTVLVRALSYPLQSDYHGQLTQSADKDEDGH
jgi:hypothetical protein